MLKRTTIHIFGLILIALGVALIISQKKGVFPWDAAGLNLVDLFARINIHIEVGIASLILNSLLGVICIAVTKNFKYLYSYINIAIFSLALGLINWALGLINWPVSDQITVLNVVMLFSGLLTIAIGTNFVVFSKLVPSPAEAAMLIIHEKWFPKSIGLSKVALEIMFFLVAITFGAINGNVMSNISWFTFIAVAILSPMIQITHKPIKLLFGGMKNESNEIK
ncbi:conserved hypothetical protein [Alteracholeplasma palmae J233]|uniref:Integral membrane protein n=1 Tax=Alteracholeplasma palmae (strain ATCC 49389 / J233) TaxID=1318466 RepID=U4KKW6_ALTPJ|nr:hypothetical protein [Alteracholeplasma palmae]CCV64449.1 conserved hypothetical protein [Alteracholeplasma palmae J233]